MFYHNIGNKKIGAGIAIFGPGSGFCQPYYGCAELLAWVIMRDFKGVECVWEWE